MQADKFKYHYFLDEAGDSTFFGKGKLPIIGQNGVSLCFIIGMVGFNEPIDEIRKQVIELQKQVENDLYFNDIPSVRKKKQKKGFFFHATEDIPEVRKIFYDFINQLDFHAELVVGQKIPSLFLKKHNQKDNEFYADLLSHLLNDKIDNQEKIVLNIAQRGTTTRSENLDLALQKAINRNNLASHKTKVVFNVQNQLNEPILNIADYCCWAVQRVFEKGETRYYNFLKDKIKVTDLYDFEKAKTKTNIYNGTNLLTQENKKCPPLP